MDKLYNENRHVHVFSQLLASTVIKGLGITTFFTQHLSAVHLLLIKKMVFIFILSGYPE